MSKRRVVWILLGIFLLYPQSYLLLSLQGTYLYDLKATMAIPRPDPPHDNPYKPEPYLRVYTWNPFHRFSKKIPFSTKPRPAEKALRIFYAPLLHLDHWLWHQDQHHLIKPEPVYPLLSWRCRPTRAATREKTWPLKVHHTANLRRFA
ncbi:MAG: hypothetical protein AAGI48_02865 [Verrucomicrobiota bacterium]